jgi:hypothetical protein
MSNCRFMGTLFTIDSPADVAPALREFLARNTRVRKSTHPHMHAWVCRGQEGCHDCGEATAGRKLQQVLESSQLGRLCGAGLSSRGDNSAAAADSGAFDAAGGVGGGDAAALLPAGAGVGSRKPRKPSTATSSGAESARPRAVPAGVLLVVTRWYGGSNLGGGRWRAISEAARLALNLFDGGRSRPRV